MTSSQRDWTILLMISIAFCVAILVEPDWNVKEAYRLCAGQPGQVFESMAACTVNQLIGCSCIRPENPWLIVYWLVFLGGVGIAAALLLRRQWPQSVSALIGAMAIGGFFGLLSRRDSFEPEFWYLAPLAFAAFIAITLAAFGLARLARHLVTKRQPAT